jgi:hypothetical protein
MLKTIISNKKLTHKILEHLHQQQWTCKTYKFEGPEGLFRPSRKLL